MTRADAAVITNIGTVFCLVSLSASVYLVSTLTHEALKRSSRRITRQRLLDAANSFYQFPVGVTHPITTVDENTRRSQLLRFDAVSRRLLPICCFR